MASLAVVAAGRTGKLVAELARRRRHRVRELEWPDDRPAIAEGAVRADALVLIPRGGGTSSHAHCASLGLITATRRVAPSAHLIIVTSFAVGHGSGHPLNRIASPPSRRDAERTARESGLPWTIVRPTWLTDDPPGAHAITLTQDPHADGMLARSDLAATVVAAVEEPLARGKTFAAFNEPGEPSDDWEAAFAALLPDGEAATP
jgi:uncharacterized protein YbjT (DUF2867 family)